MSAAPDLHGLLTLTVSTDMAWCCTGLPGAARLLPSDLLPSLPIFLQLVPVYLPASLQIAQPSCQSSLANSPVTPPENLSILPVVPAILSSISHAVARGGRTTMPGEAGLLVGNHGEGNFTSVQMVLRCMAAILGVVIAAAAILLSVTVIKVRPVSV